MIKLIFTFLILFTFLVGCKNAINKSDVSSEVAGSIVSNISNPSNDPILKTVFTGETLKISFDVTGGGTIATIQLQASFDGGNHFEVVATAASNSDRIINWTISNLGNPKTFVRVKFTEVNKAVSYSNTIGPIAVYTRIDTITGGESNINTSDGSGENIRFNAPYAIYRIGQYLYVADATSLRRLDTSVSPIQSIVFAGHPLFAGTADGIGEQARFRSIQSIAYDGVDYLYLADYTDNCIKRVKISTQEVETYAGLCGTSGTTNGVNRLAARYNRPVSIKIYNNKLYISETSNFDIRVIDLSTGNDSVLAGTTGSSGASDGTGTAAKFSSPNGIEFDDVGNLFIADTGNSFIKWININTGVVKRIGLNVTRVSNTDGINGQIAKPYFIAYYNNALYVTDANANVLRKIVYDKTNPVGTNSSNYPVFSTVAGKAGVIGEKTGAAGTSILTSPRGLSVDGNKILISSRTHKTIYSFDPSTDTVSTFYHFHHQLRDEFSLPSMGRLFYPLAITGDSNGLYVTSLGHVIQKIDLTQMKISTFAGTPFVAGTTDGNVANAKFSSPHGILKVGDGIFVADFYSNIIRYVKNGTVITIAGSPDVAGTTDSPAGAVSLFNQPNSLCYKGNDLYVSDYGNSRVRKISFTDINNPTVNPTVTTLKNGAAVITFTTPGQVLCKTTGAEQGLYVSERGSSVRGIMRVDFNGGATKIAIAGGSGVNSSIDGNGTSASTGSPIGLVAIGDNLYFTDDVDDIVRKIDLSNPSFPVTTIAGFPNSAGTRDGTLKNARFNTPKSMVAIGNKIYLADYGNHGIREIDLTNNVVKNLGAYLYDNYTNISGIQDGLLIPNNIAQTHRALFKYGNDLYTFSYGLLNKINYKTKSSEVVGGQVFERNIVDGNLSTSRLGYAQAGILDGDNYYFVDFSASLVRKINLLTMQVSSFAGTLGVMGNSATELNNPMNIAIKDNYLFVPSYSVTDGGFDIRKINKLTGEISTLAGIYGSQGVVDGNSSIAQFDNPYGATVLGNNLYITELTTNLIRKIDISDVNNPIVSTVAGSSSYITGEDNGIGGAATFASPRYLENDGVDIFIPNGSGSTIKRFNPRTNQVSTVVGTEKNCRNIDGPLNTAKICGPLSILKSDDGMFILDSIGFSVRWIH